MREDDIIRWESSSWSNINSFFVESSSVKGEFVLFLSFVEYVIYYLKSYYIVVYFYCNFFINWNKLVVGELLVVVVENLVVRYMFFVGFWYEVDFRCESYFFFREIYDLDIDKDLF